MIDLEIIKVRKTERIDGRKGVRFQGCGGVTLKLRTSAMRARKTQGTGERLLE